MNLILWIIFGALAGWIASMIMKTNAEQGAIANVVVGIVGAVIGGWVARTLIGADVTGFNITSLIIAIVGAIILLAILRAFGFMGGRGASHDV
ncbi:GlsB/YeaQ/YmgE family stress response membrane protein [Candidatus Saccharibacteria bacterium]|nr:GlsB/YeaQ/YmgE family stress response membrane protein [Candidatus Saccharibacteria bacterium]